VPIHKLKLIVTADHSGNRLDDILAGWLPNALGRALSRAKGRKLIMAGAVYVDRKRVRLASTELSEGATIEAYVDESRLFEDLTARDKEFDVSQDHILFEDSDLIVIDKPAGLPSQPTLDKARDNLLAALRRFLLKRDGEEPYIGVHHRLDRDTSGVVLFTKSRRVNAALTDMFSQHRVVKIYQALTYPGATPALRGRLQKEWTVKNYLANVLERSKRAKYGSVSSGGQPAETSFRVVQQHPHGVWVEAIPKTGRTHQIRVHLSEYGLPIIGDDLYGPRSGQQRGQPAYRLMLHASQLVFRHPITGVEISIKSPLPLDFRQCLRQIQLP